LILGDSACKANYLNENGIATIVNQDGYRLWGNRTTSGEGAYKFLCVRRTADIISDSILRAHLWAVDRNVVKNYLTDVTESVNAFLATLKSQGAILQGKCFANKELNTAANIAEGKVFFDFSFTPAYPAEQVTFRAYLDNSDLESVLFENLG
jgi:phage tail sheath protein FI